MKSVKRKVLFLLTLIPFLPASIAFAVDFGSQVAAPVVSAFDLEEEFARRLDRNLLSAKYYNFLEKENINSLDFNEVYIAGGRLSIEEFTNLKNKSFDESISYFKDFFGKVDLSLDSL